MEALESFVIQFCNNTLKRILCYPALLAFIQEPPQSFKFTLSLFKQAQSCSYHFACRSIAAIFKLFSNELVKVGTKGNAGISGHWVSPVPNIGTFCQDTHNKARQRTQNARRCSRRYAPLRGNV